MNKQLTTIIIDMYGVILEESKGNFIPYTYSHFEESQYERLTRQFKEEKLFTKAGYGELSSHDFLSLLGYENPEYHMHDYIENHLTLDKGFLSFAKKYAEKYDFVLLSTDVSEWSAYITKYHDLDKYFKHKIVSGDVHLRKPDPKIYEVTLERIGKKAEECVFIDNSVANLRGAESLGIPCVLFNRDGEEYEGCIVNSFKELDEILT